MPPNVNDCLVLNYYSSGVTNPPTSCATPAQGSGDNGNPMGYFYYDPQLGHPNAFTYDSLNRLSTAHATGTNPGNDNWTYTYNRWGNMQCIGSTGTITDEAGNWIQGEIYDPWGQRWGTYGNNYDERYASLNKRDVESGLDSTPNRMFTSLYGRWLSPDPLAGDITNPQSLNRYAYVMNNPLRYVDPVGMDFCQTNAAMLSDEGDTIYAESACMSDEEYGSALAADDGSIDPTQYSYLDTAQTDAVSTSVSQMPTASDDAAFLGYWLQGSPPSSISYGPNDGMTKQLENSSTFAQVRQQYINQGCPASSPKPMGTSHTGPYVESFITSPLSGQTNWALLQVGGFIATASTTNNVTTFTITNTAGLSSFIGQSTVAPKINPYLSTPINPNGSDNSVGPNGPMHNVNQTFQFTECDVCKQGG